MTRDHFTTLAAHTLAVLTIFAAWYILIATVGSFALMDLSMFNPVEWATWVRGFYGLIFVLTMYKFVKLTIKEW